MYFGTEPVGRDLWMQRPIAGFDLETTGVRVGSDRMVSACVARGGTGDLIREWLANPGIPIPAEASSIHGITDEIAASGRPLKEVAAEVADELYQCWAQGYTVAVFNGRFDFGILASALPGFEVRGPVIDGFAVERRIGRGIRNRETQTKLEVGNIAGRKGLVVLGGGGKRSLSLMSTCQRYGVDHPNPHQAAGDAVATIGVVQAQARRWPWLAAMTTTELVQAQQHWHHSRARRRRTADDAGGDWLIPSAARTLDLEGLGAAAAATPAPRQTQSSVTVAEPPAETAAGADAARQPEPDPAPVTV